MKDLDYKELKKIRYFSSLSDDALETIAQKLTLVELPAGTKIIRENAPADSFYLVSKGEVVVSKRTKSGQSAQIAVSGSGDSFGEMALLTCSPRCCTVAAKTDVVLYRLDKSDFEEIVSLEATFNNVLEGKARCYSEYDKLKTLQPFALLENEKVLSLIEKMSGEKYPPRTDIIKQGDKGNLFYIIKSGRAAVIRQEKDKEPEQVAVISTGDGFGEEARQ
ncbi:MAG TPA: cyclic nucleotide-binding domain-containing protein [Nitrospirae bacterium]|nr:cyclic nucleotide-binding domain-containing protein [Nitrospirota bacterium]